MKRRTLAVSIGVSALLGTGIGLVLRSQMGVGATLASAAIIKSERGESGVKERIATAESEQDGDEAQSRAEGDRRVQRTAFDLAIPEVSHSPSPPSRVSPGQARMSGQDALQDPRHQLPPPPAPSKILPGSI
jgi:hypothetical protein